MLLTLQTILILLALYVLGIAALISWQYHRRIKREELLRRHGIEPKGGAFVSHGMIRDEERGFGVKADSKPSRKWDRLLSE